MGEREGEKKRSERGSEGGRRRGERERVGSCSRVKGFHGDSTAETNGQTCEKKEKSERMEKGKERSDKEEEGGRRWAGERRTRIAVEVDRRGEAEWM